MNAKAEGLQVSTSKTVPVGLRPGTILAGLAVVLCATWWIFRGLEDQPHFADESAMIAQSYYYTLFKSGQWNHPDWLHYAAYDHPPLPKYLFGLSLDLAGLPVPPNLDRWMNWIGLQRGPSGWVPSPAGGDFSPPSDTRILYWARVPAAVFGVGGALAVFFIGLQVHGRLLGLSAAALLVLNPLYLTHARRAMSDSFTECLVIGSVALAMWGYKELWAVQFRWRRWLTFVAGESLLCGLAALAKLNGGIATAIVVSTLGLGWLFAAWHILRVRGAELIERPDIRSLLAGPVAAVSVAAGSFLLFLGLNPFLTARPVLPPEASPELKELAAKDILGRARFLLEFRRGWARDAAQNQTFRKDWLPTVEDRLRMTVWEGFGRFSVFGPNDIRTTEPRPDAERFTDYRRRSAIVWFPLCLLGLAWAARDGWLQFQSGRIPQPWALVWYTAVIAAVVVLLIPLNWDRYYLPLQACSALLVPYGMAATLSWMGSRLVLRPAEAQRT